MPVDRGTLGRGPYVWAKAEAGRRALERAAAGHLQVKTLRLGPLETDFESFNAPPGRLGRDVRTPVRRDGAAVFAAQHVCSVQTAAATAEFTSLRRGPSIGSPDVVNLLEVPATTRGDLARTGPSPTAGAEVLLDAPFFVLKGD